MKMQTIISTKNWARKKTCRTLGAYLDDDEEADAGTHLSRVPVHARHDIHNGLPDGDDHAEH